MCSKLSGWIDQMSETQKVDFNVAENEFRQKMNECILYTVGIKSEKCDAIWYQSVIST